MLGETILVLLVSVVLFTFLTTHSYLFSFPIVLSLSWNSIGLHTLNTGLVLQTLTGCWDFMTAVVLVSAITTRTAGSKFYHFLCRHHRQRCHPLVEPAVSGVTSEAHQLLETSDTASVPHIFLISQQSALLCQPAEELTLSLIFIQTFLEKISHKLSDTDLVLENIWVTYVVGDVKKNHL